ncbi:MAG TPA: AMP nucleosidase [Beijerinckiaceae bacterium]|jgi:AMP nucleosidase|nr:AMP nucleosidase [Beijerinckiaceae bacterium]
MTFEIAATPEDAIDRLEALYDAGCQALRDDLQRFFDTHVPPTAEERARYRYPVLRVTYTHANALPLSAPTTWRGFAKFPAPGIYSTTVTQPAEFRAYLLDQLRLLVEEYGATIETGVSQQEIPYPYALDGGDELARGKATAVELARYFPTPLLSLVGDEIADGTFDFVDGEPRPLSLFDAVRIDFSLRRLVHYTGTDWRDMQPWVLLTNYHRYVDQFVRLGLAEVLAGTADALAVPGGGRIGKGDIDDGTAERVMAAPWHRFQMPAYHLIRKNGEGITLVNIGVGPSNAKNITDHLAVLRPNCWLMVGHCGGLRQEQVIGDYVLAHAYLRQDHILDELVPPDIPIPALAEIQVALQEAAAEITGEKGERLKRRLRTGTVVTQDDRNWELQWTKERRRINQSRAVAVDMESGTIAAQGYRLRVPYGTLLCVSDKPLHGEIKLPGAANAFYERAVGEHLKIGLRALSKLNEAGATIHSRKLRSFDEPPFR